ncbi:VRR-NUC domain-containing protein [Caproicibacterium sp. XB1]|uniref:VRR-NUC domain-containing protein n=1 Tax=Caproicibacterium sp. XB1 TaxID=3396405 RepID=UPI0039B6F8A8
MKESNIQNAIRCELSKYGIVFRTNAGKFYQGQTVYSREFGQRVLINLRCVDGLPKGFSDLVFFESGGKAVFIETKNEFGKLRPEQQMFLKRMQQLGFSAGVARSTDEAVSLIGKAEEKD